MSSPRSPALAARLEQPWPKTLTVVTPSGGRHLHFGVPDGCTIGSYSGARSPLGPGVDLRGPGLRRGGYLIGPGKSNFEYPSPIELEENHYFAQPTTEPTKSLNPL
ncbi:bifunctional DNA primase/polymerase [Streptomyces sp. T-3]|nr:bifunctional DNA primase/polymerase [Streptomyces sp. T-3]